MSGVRETIKQYFKTTTLHGFKYLLSIHIMDRVGWLACCCASACCAGVLCAVLWSRFLEVPALLALCDDMRACGERLPSVAVCPPPESLADMFLNQLPMKSPETEHIPLTLARLLTGKSTDRDQLLLLDELLATNNVTLPQVLMNYSSNCSEYTRRCRYQNRELSCEQLFEKELTYWGLCCVMRPNKLLKLSKGPLALFHTTQMLDFALQCTHGSTVYGCQFWTMYDGEETARPEILLPGYYYMALLRFVAIPANPNVGELVERTCVHDALYSKGLCKLQCVEKACGCSDPVHYKSRHTNTDLPICQPSKLACLRANEYKESDNISCHCLPSCKKITSYMVLESSPMSVIKQAIDPLFSGLNATSSIVVNLRVNMAQSRVFLLDPTETWLTLLSSLGGVFNMFLGVGLFTALEFMYFIIIKCPIAIRNSSQIKPHHSGLVR